MAAASADYASPRFAKVATAVFRVLTLEPALLDAIVDFAATSDASASTAAVALETVRALCRAVPGLGARLGPQNEFYWRAMVLRYFDFTEDPTKAFNVEDNAGYFHACSYVDDSKEWRQHPARGPVESWNAAHLHEDGMPMQPSCFLENDMAYWATLGAFFRPHEYGFLCGGEPRQPWSADQDAYSLFFDLLLLEKLKACEGLLGTWSDREQCVACLLGRFDGDLSDGEYDMLAFCGILPHFWAGLVPVSDRWSGFDGPVPSMVITRRKLSTSLDEEDEQDEQDREEEDVWECATPEERSLFPLCGATQSDLVCLRRLVYESFSDWRRVHVNVEEFTGPEFYIGKSKRSGRWLGFVGESNYGCDPQLESSSS